VYKNTKCPYSEDWLGKKIANFRKNAKPCNDYNTALVCGKISDVTVVDLDVYKWKTDDHIFYKTFGKDFVKKFNTYTVKTGRGGYHLYFKYTDIPNINSKELEIDVKNDNGLIITADSIVDGNRYSTLKKASIKKMPKELKDFLLKHGKTKLTYSQIKKKVTKEFKTDLMYENDVNLKADINDDEFMTVCKTLPKSYIDEFDNWFIFTTACKTLNKKDIWNKISKQSDSYSNDNEKYWNKANSNAYGTVYNLFRNSAYPDLLDHILYSDIPKSSRHPDKTINKTKVSNVIKKGSYIIKSDTGTGKTTTFVNHIKKNSSKFISIVDRVTLSFSHYNTFNSKGVPLNHYQMELREGESNVICLNSIIKLQHYDLSDYDLFLDEVSAIIKTAILCKTISNRMYIYHALKCIIREVRSVIAVDADIDDIVVDFLKSIRKDFTYINNEFKHNKDVPATEISKEQEFIDLIKKEDKFIVCCDSASKANHLYDLLEDEDIVVITDETVGDKIHEFTDIDKFDKIIFSPKIVRGIDSQMKRKVFCYYKEHTITPDDMIQQLTRCRNIEHLYFMFTKKKYTYTFYKPYYQSMLSETNEFGQKEFVMMGEKYTTEYLKYLTECFYKEKCYASNKYIHFIKLLKQRGFKVKRTLIKSVCMKRSKEDKQNDHDALIDDFDLQKYPNVNKYLRLKKDQISSDIKELYIDSRKLEQHFILCKYLFRDDHDAIKNLEDSQDFKVRRVTSTDRKIIFLRKLMKHTGTSNDNLQIQKNIKSKYINDFQKEYSIIFRDRSKCKFDNKKDLQQILIKVLRNIFGNDIVKNERNKKRTSRNYYINSELLQFTEKVYNLRN
jgi:hypothetical protein